MSKGGTATMESGAVGNAILTTFILSLFLSSTFSRCSFIKTRSPRPPYVSNTTPQLEVQWITDFMSPFLILHKNSSFYKRDLITVLHNRN